MNSKHVSFAIVIMFVLIEYAMAQTSLNMTTYLIRDDNAFKTRYAYTEWINTSNLYIEQRLATSGFQFQGYYSPDVMLFSKRNTLNNYSHQFGTAGSWTKNAYSIRMNINSKLRHYQDDLDYYNVNALSFSGQMEYRKKLTTIYSLNVSARKDRYLAFSDLDNVTYRYSGRFQHFFQTRTSLTAETGLGVKDYVNQTRVQYYGMGFGPFDGVRYREDPVQATMYFASMTLGQSLRSRTGISLGIGGQWFLGDPIMTYTGGIYYYTENDLYDDPFSYRNQYISLDLTRQFDVSFQGKIGFKIQDKYYQGTPALDQYGFLLGGMRKDVRKEFYIMTSKSFSTGWAIPRTVTLFFNYTFRDNASNDPYFKYQDHVGLVGFSFGLLNPKYDF
jgi:hypothetical protein